MTPAAPAAARSDLAPTGKLRVGINYGNFLLFAEDAKASGLVARAIEKHNVRGVNVAPMAPGR